MYVLKQCIQAILLLSLFTLPTIASAQLSGKVFPFPVKVFQLENGLTFVSVIYDSPGIIAYYTIVRTGSRNEVDKGFSGYAHFFEHMMFRGTEECPSEKYNQIIKQLGAESNAFTTDDWTAYHFLVNNEALETIMEIESDRFINLKYSREDFKTEAGAILGEYSMNFSNPFLMLSEKLYGEAFVQHPYKHTTLGFLDDIKDMPNHYDYSVQFYDRYYRPENCIVLVVGDVDQKKLETLAKNYYGNWKHGSFVPSIPKEPSQTGEKTARITRTVKTLPHLMIGYHTPAFSDTSRDIPAIDILSQLVFSQNSPLFQRLFVEEQVVDLLAGGAVDHRDPHLFEITARVTKPDKIEYVQNAILTEIEKYKTTPVDRQKLADTKSYMRYSFAMNLNSAKNIAETVGHYLQLTRDPETVNRIYEQYEKVTAEDIMRVAKTYFTASNRSVVILTEGGK